MASSYYCYYSVFFLIDIFVVLLFEFQSICFTDCPTNLTLRGFGAWCSVRHGMDGNIVICIRS